jgi:excinuclease ABC subunit B
MLYGRNDMDFSRGKFRVRGDVVEVYPATADEEAIRLEFFGDEIEAITRFDPLTGHAHEQLSVITFYPAKQFVTPRISSTARSAHSKRARSPDRGARIAEPFARSAAAEDATEYDLEMLQEMGFCNGIENYSRHLSGRMPGSKPFTLLDFFPKDYLLVIDESHATIPQIGGMFEGDRSRKTVLVEYGFRLPARSITGPLNFKEFMGSANQLAYVSATPAEFEITNSVVGNTGYVPHKRDRVGMDEMVPFVLPGESKNGKGAIVSRTINRRKISTSTHRNAARRRADHQAHGIARSEDHAQRLEESDRRHDRALPRSRGETGARARDHAHQANGRDLSDYLRDVGLKVRYLHSDIDTIERVEILRSLRAATSTSSSASTSSAKASISGSVVSLHPRCR